MTEPSKGFPQPPVNVVDLASRLPFQGKGPDNTGEPPGGDGMGPRIARLEDEMKEVRGDLKAIRSDLAELKGKVSMLPGWGGMLAVAAFIVTAVGLMLRFMPPAH